jgi:hypothetical protein
MSVNVNTVYQRVLAITNKEQRGYITPQEFNTMANQAQLDIFEQYFYDINQFARIPGNGTEYSDMLNILEEKVSLFEKQSSLGAYDTSHYNLPADLYRIGSVIYNNIEAEQINQKEWLYIQKSPLSKPTDSFPIYIKNQDGLKVYGAAEITADNAINCNYIKQPTPVTWAANATVGTYNDSASTHFELHESEETELVVKILALGGLVLKDPQLYQIGSAEDVKNVQQEKA